MASLHRKTVIRLDTTTGRKVKTKSKKWWGQYKDALGRLRRVPLSVDKQCAQTMLTRITRQVERERAGLVDPTEEQRKRPLAEHLNEFNEFARLVAAARGDKRIEGMHGPDRAMLYIVAAWTGFRKAEIGSLTLRSLRLDDAPPTATVAACYSKHRRQDTQILHPELVRQLKA
ncbi:MAG: hypothetical protein ACUVS7_17155, partial [Bryobacteraceae bacterium]